MVERGEGRGGGVYVGQEIRGRSASWTRKCDWEGGHGFRAASSNYTWSTSGTFVRLPFSFVSFPGTKNHFRLELYGFVSDVLVICTCPFLSLVFSFMVDRDVFSWGGFGNL